MEKKITVMKQKHPLYDIVLERNYDKLCEYLKQFQLKDKKVCIVMDSNVEIYYKIPLQSILTESASMVTTFTFTAGEEYKNLNTVQMLYEHLIQHKFDRKDIMFACGGGVVGDLTGYTAATYLRGISFVQMPTTLLSMVDSSIGGKTGVDFQSYKNMVGAFHQPSFVYMAFHTLSTLDERQFNSGMAEIIKHGLILDSSYFHWIQVEKDNIKNHDINTVMKLVETSCHIKRKVVEIDPKEQCERALLNFGHTIGHSVETLTNFQLTHGECVSIGIVAAAYISFLRGHLDHMELIKIENILSDFKLPISIPREYQTESLIDAIVEEMKHDKKMESGQIKFILLQKIGTAVIDRTVTDIEIRKAVSYVTSTNHAIQSE